MHPMIPVEIIYEKIYQKLELNEENAATYLPYYQK